MPGCEWPRPWSYDEVRALLARVVRFGINPSLAPITALCEALGRPQSAYQVVQITGTNGKTSTARMTAALLGAHASRVGLYTSPELERYPERFEARGIIATDAEFARAVGVAADTARALWGESELGVPAGVTEFELLTAAALWHFREMAVDIAVLEVGMGGRWDATSVTQPAVAVITGVGLDHTDVLGETIEAIAAEKAAIIAPASVPVLGPGTAEVEAVFLDRSLRSGTQARAVREAGVASPVAEDFTVRFTVRERPASPGGQTVLDVAGLYGSYPALAAAAPAYQAGNVAAALAASEAALGRALDIEAVRAALLGVRLPGRFELVRDEPPLVVDGAHNPQAAHVLAEAISHAWPDADARPIVLLGMLSGKDAAGVVEALAPVASGFAVASPDSPRALGATELASVVLAATGRRPAVFASVVEAALSLVASPLARAGMVVTGSLTSAGQVRAALRDTSATP